MDDNDNYNQLINHILVGHGVRIQQNDAEDCWFTGIASSYTKHENITANIQRMFQRDGTMHQEFGNV